MKNPAHCFIPCVLLIATSILGGCSPAQKSTFEDQTTVLDRLESDVRTLSVDFADRNANNRGMLNDSGVWIGKRLSSMGYAVDLEPVQTAVGPSGFNVVAELTGTTLPEEIIVVGAHYDTELNTPGADDNASGVAGMLEIAQRLARNPLDRTVRFVAFTNEENSNSAGGLMGSFVHAREAKKRNDNIVAMMSLEMLGFYSDEPNSQQYPFDPKMAANLGMELPTVGNYIGIVGRMTDRELVDQLGASMRSAGTIDVTPAALPAVISAIWRSDHGSFWLVGYNAVMVTDTSEYRNPHYHKRGDTIETLDFDRMGATVDALVVGVRDLATMDNQN
ncbi:MAG: M20/M25/M40 family metallo-hydrolase [Phycisphaerales bacterium]|nr:M20/M25/M40 family metallo-hydrolase [Phycisphaerales bacterium]